MRRGGIVQVGKKAICLRVFLREFVVSLDVCGYLEWFRTGKR